jgi:hypothetical protein
MNDPLNNLPVITPRTRPPHWLCQPELAPLTGIRPVKASPTDCGINGSIRAHAASLSSAERTTRQDSRDHRTPLGRHALVVCAGPIGL